MVAVFGGTVLASIGHLAIIGLAMAGAGVVLYRARRLAVRRAMSGKRLKG